MTRKTLIAYSVVLCMVVGSLTVAARVGSSSGPSAGSWTAPELISGNRPDAILPIVHTDWSGNVIAAWVEPWGNHSTPGIFANRFVPGVGWGSPVKISGDQPYAQELDLAVSVGGKAIATWVSMGGTRNSIWASCYDPATGWSVATLIEQSEMGNADRPHGAMDASGNAVVVWDMINESYNGVNLWSNSYISGTWGNPVMIGVDGLAPSIGVSTDGRAIAVWYGHSSYQVSAATYSGGVWSAPVVLSDSGSAVDPQISVNETGSALAIWRDSRTSASVGSEIWCSRYTPWSGWTGSEMIAPVNGGYFASYPEVASDRLGGYMVVWEQSNTWEGGNFTVWAKRLSWDGVWGPATKIQSFSVPYTNSLPAIAVDGAGDAVCVWRQVLGSDYHIFYNSYSVSRGWGTSSQLDQASVPANFPDVTMDLTGVATAVWAQGYEDSRSIWSSTMGTPPPPASPIVIERQTGRVKTVSWTYVAPSDGTWTAVIENHGLRSAMLDIYDQSDNSTNVFHQLLRFARMGIYPTGTMVSEPCEMYSGHVYLMIASGISGSKHDLAYLWNQFESTPPVGGVFLDEKFDSWATLDDGWTIWNRTLGDFQNWFDISNGSLVASNNGVLIYADYTSYANWSGPVGDYDDLSISFKIYLPMNSGDKIGWSGQVFWLELEDASGQLALVTRWVMDRLGDTAAVGWVYWPGGGAPATTICSFAAGWHTVGLVLDRWNNTWTAVFDGVSYPGLTYTSDVNGFDFRKMILVNALREETQIVQVDDMKIESGSIAPPPPPPPPELGWTPLTVPTGHYMNLYGINTSEYGGGIHVDTIGSSDLAYEFMAVKNATYQVGQAGTIEIHGYFKQFDTLYSYDQPGRRFVRIYVLDAGNSSIVGSVDALDYTHAVNTWYHRDVLVGGLTPGSIVKVGIGRTDNWEIDWSLTAEWAGVVIMPDNQTVKVLVAEAGPAQYVWGQDTIYFDGSGSYSSVGIASYDWLWVSGNGTLRTLTGMKPSCPAGWFSSYGNNSVLLTVTDIYGRTAWDNVSIDFGFRKYYNDPMGAQGFYAPTNGYYKLRIENQNMTSVDWTVLDVDLTIPPYEVFHATINFNWSGLYVSEPVWMTAGRHYQSEYVPHGPVGSYVTIYAFFVPVW